ncbi:hypothetical protein [Alkalibacillus haloalkaliphilus]|uniref:hypothetical protein n=1 Tax=Alkalibacillus haloalkaliphilus TaxID=94136 RepID=UPI002936A454|nr:hypothetical protein [Alkalibacillus haloalkaliphilus]MDV2582053.1 hypothetical protein [Alkalibacillus haloalkaliphilus]
MKNDDFRVQFPLWNIALLLILSIWSYGVVYAIDLVVSDFEGVFYTTGQQVYINWHMPSVLSLVIGQLALIAFFIIYFIKLRQYNKNNPGNELRPFTLFKPHEFLEDDELFRQVTERTTKKVYVLYAQAVPVVIFLIMFLPTHRFLYIALLFGLLIAHNALYYWAVRKFMNGKTQLSHTGIKPEKRLSKFTLVMIAIIVFLALAFPTYQVVQIQTNQERMLEQFERCLEDGHEAILTYDGTVNCSKD